MGKEKQAAMKYELEEDQRNRERKAKRMQRGARKRFGGLSDSIMEAEGGSGAGGGGVGRSGGQGNRRRKKRGGGRDIHQSSETDVGVGLESNIASKILAGKSASADHLLDSDEGRYEGSFDPSSQILPPLVNPVSYESPNFASQRATGNRQQAFLMQDLSSDDIGLTRLMQRTQQRLMQQRV